MNHTAIVEEQTLVIEDSMDVRDSGLESKPLTALESIGFLVGTNIGAGVLSLAYASRKAGFIPLLVCLAVAYIIGTISMLYMAEASLRTKGNRQFSGLAHRYLGTVGSWIVFFGIVAGCYGALTAYIAGSGDILNAFFGDSLGVSKQVGSILFFVPAIGLMYVGFKALGVGQKIISSGMTGIVIVLIMATAFHDNTNLNNLLDSDWAYVIPIFNVAIFILGAQSLVPEIVRGNLETPERISKLIVGGMGIVLLIIVIIPASIIALVGLENVTQVATLAWGGQLGNWAFYTASTFALLAMLTSYWGMGGILFSNMFDHLQLGSESDKIKRILVLTVIAVPPFILAYFDKVGFVNALYFSGTAGGIIKGVVTVLILRNARKYGDQNPAYRCGLVSHPIIQYSIITIFVLSAVYAISGYLGLLPASW